MKLEEIWKYAAAIAISCVISMAGYWLTESGKYITRSEASVMIQNESPYNKDREILMASLPNVKELSAAVIELRIEIAKLRIEIDRLNKQEGSK